MTRYVLAVAAVAALAFAIPASSDDLTDQRIADLDGQVATLFQNDQVLNAKASQALKVTRCFRAAIRVQSLYGTVNGRRQRVLVRLTDFPDVKGSYFLATIHPSCLAVTDDNRHTMRKPR